MHTACTLLWFPVAPEPGRPGALHPPACRTCCRCKSSSEHTRFIQNQPLNRGSLPASSGAQRVRPGEGPCPPPPDARAQRRKGHLGLESRDGVVIASRRDPELVEPPPDARNRPGSFPAARYHQYRYALATRLGLTGRSDGLAEVPAPRRLRRGNVHRKMVQAAASRCNINATPKSSISSFGCRRRWWRHIRGSGCVDIDHLCSYHHQSLAA